MMGVRITNPRSQGFAIYYPEIGICHYMPTVR
jgi:hypothetical protein